MHAKMNSVIAEISYPSTLLVHFSKGHQSLHPPSDRQKLQPLHRLRSGSAAVSRGRAERGAPVPRGAADVDTRLGWPAGK